MLFISFCFFSLSHSATDRLLDVQDEAATAAMAIDQTVRALQASRLALENDEMSRQHHFTCQDYFNESDDACKRCREISDFLQCHIRDCGTVKAVGGGVSVLSGCALIGGVLLAPASGGTSLALTIGGIAGGVASGVTTISAEVIKSNGIERKCKEVEQKLEAIQEKRDVIHRLIQEVATLENELNQQLEAYGEAHGRIESGYDAFLQSLPASTGVLAYSTYLLLSTSRATRHIYQAANFIGADAQAISGCAQGLTAPGMRIFTAGGRAARGLSIVGGAVSIGFGIWDMVDGIKDTQGAHDVVNKIREKADAVSDAVSHERQMIEDIHNANA